MSLRLPIALIVISLSLTLTAHAGVQGPGSSDLYTLRVFKVEVAPTKADGHVWDGTAIIRDLPDPRGIMPMAYAAVAAKRFAAAGIDATANPDVYAIVEAKGKKLQTSVDQDTCSATWDDSDHPLTVQLRAGDYLKIRIIDQDLQESTRDEIGSVLHKLTEDELSAGVIEIDKFGAVEMIQLTITPLRTRKLLYSPGNYRVTIYGARISPIKPVGGKNAGKAWDALGGAPDPFGAVTIGTVELALPKIQNSLRPAWRISEDIALDETSSISIRLSDKDLMDKTNDEIGTISVAQILGQRPGRDGMIHLTNHAAIQSFTIGLRLLPKSVTVEECSALARHTLELLDAGGQEAAAAKLRTHRFDVLRACASRVTKAQLDCSMAATSLAAMRGCK